MMYHRKIGSADVYNIVEMVAPTHDPAVLFTALTAPELAALAPRLAPHHYLAGYGRLMVAIQIWIVKTADRFVVIDTGVGNAKPRGLPRFDRLNTLVPTWIDSLGGAEAVTDVINTHLHGDHVGGNTIATPDGYAPAFPNARYWMGQKDYDYWHPRFIAANGVGETEAFTDAVVPLVDAGRVTFYEEGQEFGGGLTAVANYGHTPGQMRIDLQSDGALGSFCADVFHSPLQILRPDINTVIDVEPDIARETRHAFLSQMAQTGALVMPCHFGAPHSVRITRDGDGFGFTHAGS